MILQSPPDTPVYTLTFPNYIHNNSVVLATNHVFKQVMSGRLYTYLIGISTLKLNMSFAGVTATKLAEFKTFYDNTLGVDILVTNDTESFVGKIQSDSYVMTTVREDCSYDFSVDFIYTKEYNVRTFQVSLSATPASVYALTGIRLCTSLLIQAPSTNTDLAYFGDSTNVVMELDAGGSSGLDVTTTETVYVKGTSPDKLNICVL